MRGSRYAVRCFALAVGLLLAVAAPASAQGPRISPAGATRLAHEPHGPDVRVRRGDLLELSRYAGWGGTIGGITGVAYGLAFERGTSKGLEVIADGLIGFTGGLVGGAIVYAIRFALGG